MKPIWIVVISVILTGAVIGGGVYYWQNKKLNDAKKDLNNQITDLKNQVNDLKASINNASSVSTSTSSAIAYKKIDYSKDLYAEDGSRIKFEIPETWSLAKQNGDDVEKFLTTYASQAIDFRSMGLSLKPKISFAQDYINFSGSNPLQAGLYFSTKNIKDELEDIANSYKDGKITWTKETVGGISADVANDSANGYEGNKIYYLTLPKNNQTLVIIKQSTGVNKEFDAGFQHFIESLVFAQ